MTLACGRRIDEKERFEIESRFPWINNHETLFSKDSELLELFKKFRDKGLDEIYFGATLLPLQTVIPDEALTAHSASMPTQPKNDTLIQTQNLQSNTDMLSGSYIPICPVNVDFSDNDSVSSGCYYPTHIQYQTNSSSEAFSQTFINLNPSNTKSSTSKNNEDDFDQNEHFAWNQDEDERNAEFEAYLNKLDVYEADDCDSGSDLTVGYQSNDSER